MKLVCVTLALITLASCGEEKPGDLAQLDLDGTAAKPALTPLNSVEGSPLTSTKLEPFSSPDAFFAYTEALRVSKAEESQQPSCPDCTDELMPAPVNAAPGSADSITNNQEGGVDEGDIVKAVGDYLIVLRRGQLFSIRIKNADETSLAVVDTINAYPEHHSTQTWYDELLIYENKLIVIGYSYGYGATEIGQFVLNSDGAINHVKTNFLRSNDYYSSRNYASRLIDNKLVLYMPFYFFDGVDEQITLPGQASFLPSGQKTAWEDIIDVETIVKPIEETLYPVLHTIATCDLSSAELSCNATALIGPSSRSFYVSKSAVYLWTSNEEGAQVYRMPLDGTSPSALRAQGTPIDQFSFKETNDGFLHVLVREAGYGDAMWAPEFRDGAVALLSVPLSRLSAEPREASINDYAILPMVQGHIMQNRFVGDFILYGLENGWGVLDGKNVYIHNVKKNVTKSIELEHDVQRIEPVDTNALVVGTRENDLALSVIDLHDVPTIADTFVMENTSQGERRSHGFFYKSLAEGEGIFGLPTRNETKSFSELFVSSASIKFFGLSNNKLRELGKVDSSIEENTNDACAGSCVDWYGNSRPIFLGDRILGLMGYDLVEAGFADGIISEHARLNFMPRVE